MNQKAESTAWRGIRGSVVAVAFLGMAATAVLTWVLKPSSQPIARGSRTIRFTVPVEGGHEMGGGVLPGLAISPDGQTLVYVAEGRLFRRALASVEAESLAGTAGAESPFFAPDGRAIGFTRGGTFKKISVEGGPVTDITDVRVGTIRGASWSEDGSIVYARALGTFGLWQLPADGGQPRRITTVIDSLGETAHMWPQMLDHDRLVLFTVIGPSGGWEDAKIVLQDVQSGERTIVREQATYGRYLLTGHIVYGESTGTVLALPFHLGRRESTGSPSSLESGVRVALFGGAVSFAASDGGTMAFVRGSSFNRHRLWWVDRDGNRLTPLGPTLTTSVINLSPDGTRIALEIRQANNDDVFLLDATTGARNRFTSDPAEEERAIWSPDGRRIAYVSAWRGSARRVYVKEVDRSGAPTLLYTHPRHLHLTSWSADGRWIAFYDYHPDNQRDVYVLLVDDVDSLVRVAVTSADEANARFSPDGRWLAYDSDEGGRAEVYAVSFPDLHGKQQISVDGGSNPRWSASGDELFFWKGSSLMAASVSTGDSLRRGAPRSLLDVSAFGRGSPTGRYDVAPDARRFVLNLNNPDAPAREIHVVVNGLEALRAGGME